MEENTRAPTVTTFPPSLSFRARLVDPETLLERGVKGAFLRLWTLNGAKTQKRDFTQDFRAAPLPNSPNLLIFLRLAYRFLFVPPPHITVYSFVAFCCAPEDAMLCFRTPKIRVASEITALSEELDHQSQSSHLVTRASQGSPTLVAWILQVLPPT